MKLNDDITLSIAAAVSDVLEGKVKEEGKYPHDMFHPETGEKKVAKDEAEHKALADKGYTHDKPEVDEVAEPKAKGEKDFKGAHKTKKSGAKEDGTVVKEAEESDEEDEEDLDEAKLKAGKGKVKVDIDHTGDGIPAAEKQFKLKFKKHSRNGYDVSGEKKNILAFLQSKLYSMDTDDIEELFPELLEAKSKFQKPQVKKAVALALKMGGNMTGAIKKIEQMVKGLSKDAEVAAALQLANESVTEEVLDEAHAINKTKTKMQEDKERYQKFFKSALKKFGVTSPGDLEGEKKKEFFNYVDKNYEADNETDKDEGTLPPALQKAIDKKNGKKTDDDEVEENKMNEAKKIQDIARKYKRELQKIQKSGNLELSKKAEDELYQWASSNGEIRGDEEDEFWNWIDKNVDDLIKGKIKEETIAEASITTFTDFDDYPIEKQAKALKLKVKAMKGKGNNSQGHDKMTLTGSESDLIKYFIKYMGADRNAKFSDIKSEFNESLDEGTIAEAQIRTSFESDEMKNVGGDKAAKKLKIKISFKKGKGDGMMGSDAGIFTGDEKNLVKYFQDFMGFEGKTFKELQKEYS